MVGPGKNAQSEGPQKAGHCFISRIYHRAHHGWVPEENSQSKGSQMAGKCFLKLVFANTVNTFFNYNFFQLLYKHYVAFNSSKIT